MDSRSRTESDANREMNVDEAAEDAPAFNVRGDVVNIIQGSSVTQGSAGTPMRGSDVTNQERQSSIDRVRQPIGHFAETEKYKHILRHVEMKTLVLHCYGVPGSGKSEIIRKLAQEFPTGASKLYIKWHIQCDDSGHDLKTELKELVEALHKHALLSREGRYQEILADIDKDLAGSLIRALCGIKIPVLLLIEDVKPESKTFLQDLIRSLSTSRQSESLSETEEYNFHVYMATRRKMTDLPQEEYSKISFYKMEAVQGFNKDEGVQYLLNGGSNDQGNRVSAERVYDRFSGLPLGLRIAKSYCHSEKQNYAEYLDAINVDSEDDIRQYEEELNKEEYGDDAQHIFQAITSPFHLKKNAHDKDARLTWKVLSCLSWFHYDRIPSILLERCCQEVWEGPKRNVSFSNRSKKIIRKLVDRSMCTKTDEGDITFHEVVIHAFRLDRRCDSYFDNFNPLKSAISVLASLVTKDMREKDINTKMHRLIRHGQSVLQHTKDTAIFDDDSDEDQSMLRMIVSHLYETFGAIILAKSPLFRHYCDEYFEKAISLMREEDMSFFLDPSDTKPVEEVAEFIVRKCEGFAEDLPKDFILQYESKLSINFADKSVVGYLEGQCSDRAKFGKVKKAIKSCSPNLELIPFLRESGVFLGEARHRLVFFAERLASVLHSWSRVILYGGHFDETAHQQYVRYSDLTRAISMECRKKYDIGLLTEHLATVGGMIPIILKEKKNTNALIRAKEMCEKALDKNADSSKIPMYEHGLLKEVFGATHLSGRILLLRHIVKIYTRLEEPQLLQEGHRSCEDLYDLTTNEQNLTKLSNTLICVIQCAKYYASKMEFDKALECFRFYFDHVRTLPQSHSVHSWAVYNYARATSCGRLSSEVRRAIDLCQTVLQSNEVMGAELNNRLANVWTELTEIR